MGARKSVSMYDQSKTFKNNLSSSNPILQFVLCTNIMAALDNVGWNHKTYTSNRGDGETKDGNLGIYEAELRIARVKKMVK